MPVAAMVKIPTQADKNYPVFEKLLPELMQTRPGQFALMHDGAVVAYFDSLAVAARTGRERFGDTNFSVQEITSQDTSLGFHSYALCHISS
jgi:hypothetical protein